ncbi:MAG: ankyrin repeat domain-containing protein [Rickettsiaceae bacterium]|nr:ankyrin repeat domain-containing protein [Rickettsiaceae bacterium]
MDYYLKSTNLKSCLDIKQVDLFGELLALVIDDKNAGILKLIVDELKLQVELKQQKIPETQETLLDIAARYGAKDIVTFLLTVGLDPNNKDNNGQTPLHKAVMANSPDIISLLINRRAGVNIQDTDGNTPLHLATLSKLPKIVEQLAFHGAQKHIRNNEGYNYSTLHKLVATGKAKLAIKAPPSPEINEDLGFHKGITNFYKAVLSEENKENYFVSAINDIKSFIDQLPNPSEKIEYINSSLEFLVKLYQYYKYEDSAELQKYIIDKVTFHKLPTISILLYNIMCVEFLAAADYHNAIKYAEYAHTSLLNSSKELQTKTYEGSLYEILFNLGLAWKYLDPTKSLDYFAKAGEIRPGDPDTITQLLKHYLALADVDNASEQIKKIKDSDLRDLYEIILNIVKFTPDALSVASLTNHAQKVTNPTLKDLSRIMLEFASKLDASLWQLLSTFFQKNTLKGLESYLEIYQEIWLKFFLQKKEFNKAIECCDEINICTAGRNVPIQLFKILEICKKARFWDKGLKFIEEKYQKHKILQHHGFSPLEYLKFVFYKQNDLEEKSAACLNFLKTNANLGDKSALSLLSDANEFAFHINVEKGNFDKALEYLYSVPLNNKTNKLIYLLNKLKQYIENDLINLAPLTELEKEKEKSNTVLIDLTEDHAELDNFDPSAVNAYFKKKKQALVAKSVDTTIKEQPSVWHIGKDTYASNQQDVYPIEGKPGFYATIDQKLADKLDHQLLEKFKPVLSKWSTGKNNGVKLLPGGIELKIPSDDYRLHTERVYENPKRKFLIVFNHLGNHKKTKEAAMTKCLKIIKTKETSCALPLPKEPECSTSTQGLDLDLILAMSLQEHEEMKVLGVNDD